MNRLRRWLTSGPPGITQGARHAVVYLFALCAVLGGVSLFWTSHEVGRVARVAATVQSEHQTEVYACTLANQTRTEELRLWRHIITITSPPPHQTRSQRKARHALISGFVSYLKHVFGPRNCAAIYRLRH